MERPTVRIVESPLDRAADVRARSNSTLYWLERTGLVLLIITTTVLLGASPIDDLPWWLKIVPGLVFGAFWGRLDRGIKVRYGRAQRFEEVVAEMEAEELAELRAGRAHFPPIVS